ncbi:putative regulator of chromosome condensation like protein [Tribonema minus]|uniref:Putative regulator of chromosome condensation like protein n=1 Tax=Tribonema minus TaxID=303371 RepID=A0A835Z3W4_9STRA|nr:putative regulator of chromosome condensation like protein [Tribonema minus]
MEMPKARFGVNPILSPVPLPGFEKGGVRDVACGQNHTAVVTTSGELLTFGNGSYFKLGHGARVNVKEPTVVQENVKEPTVVQSLSDAGVRLRSSLSDAGVRLRSVACGDSHTAAIDEDGLLYTWGWGGSLFSGGGALGHGSTSGDVKEPQLVEAVADVLKAVQVGAGENHTAILTDDGEVWACGAGEYGRLGNGGTSDCATPTPVLGLEDKVITRLSVGHAFTLALASTGELYGWGRNDAGQLGLGGGFSMDVYAMENLPRQVAEDHALGTKKIVAMAAGHSHACAVTDDGKLYMWGMKRYLEPEHMSVMDNETVTDVGCGDKYAAVITQQGDMFTFGKGRSNCLGHGATTTLPQPTLVEFFERHNLRVVKVACGHRHVAALVIPPDDESDSESDSKDES